MQSSLLSVFFLKKLAKKNASRDAPSTDSSHTTEKTRRERFTGWLSQKPEPISLYPGEKELFRKGLVLVTDTRLAYIDPFDRMLKTYMFEHMISVHKQFYRTTVFNRRLCKGLLILSFLALLIILTIDLLDSTSRGFFLIYIPLIASMFLGFKVWHDMKPRYAIHWRMRDQTFGEIVQEPLLRERITGSTKREVFMTELIDAMNHGLAGKQWWPNNRQHAPQTTIDKNESPDKPTLKLVTDNYQ